MKNELFVTAGEVAQELGVSKPFAYKKAGHQCVEDVYINAEFFGGLCCWYSRLDTFTCFFLKFDTIRLCHNLFS